MPELHQLMPILGVLQDRGHAVALVTDGRLSGASGKVPAAIHVTPEASKGGVIGRVQDGDLVAINVATGELNVMVDEDVLAAREQAEAPASPSTVGRALFAFNRHVVTDAERGGCTLFEAPVLVEEPIKAATQTVAYGHCVS
jgi:phosphogluconate dehydratase